MNISLIIQCAGFILILAMLIWVDYRIKHDISTCSRCPFTKDPTCWECRRKFNIKENKYNTKR